MVDVNHETHEIHEIISSKTDLDWTTGELRFRFFSFVYFVYFVVNIQRPRAPLRKACALRLTKTIASMRNIKLTLSYDGTAFSGWQTQPNFRTVQETLERAIEVITGEVVHAQASGRTDAGVHALGQVANFPSSTRLVPDVLLRAINAHLPPDLAVLECVDAAPDFHANKNAIRKLYRYVILDSPVHSPFLHRYAAQSRHRLDAQKMARASRCLLGKHDFRSFETDWPNRLTSIRTILHLTVNRVGEYIWIDVAADGFLYNMVRAIAGTLMNVGRGLWPEEKVAAILAAEDRKVAGPTAPAQGLFLVRVTYANAEGAASDG